MANALNISLNMQFTPNGGATQQLQPAGISQAPSSALTYLGTQSIATTDTTLQVGDVSAFGKLLIVNLDTSNYVEIDSASTYDKFPQKVLKGDFILLSPETTTIHAKANTSAVIVQVFGVNS